MYEESGESLGLSVISRGSRQESNVYLVESGNIVRGNAVPAELFKALHTCKARQTPVADSGHFCGEGGHTTRALQLEVPACNDSLCHTRIHFSAQHNDRF